MSEDDGKYAEDVLRAGFDDDWFSRMWNQEVQDREILGSMPPIMWDKEPMTATETAIEQYPVEWSEQDRLEQIESALGKPLLPVQKEILRRVITGDTSPILISRGRGGCPVKAALRWAVRMREESPELLPPALIQWLDQHGLGKEK